MKEVVIKVEKAFPLIFLVVLVLTLSAQNEEKNSVAADSLASDSLLIDSLQTELQPDSLFYAADSVFDFMKKERIELCGNATIKYHTSHIKADTISIDIKKNQAFSKGQSQLKDGQHTLLGDEIYYDLDSQTGMVEDGASKFDKGFYYGKEIRKIGKNTFDVDGGFFTSCDALNPHFYIATSKLRLYRNDKIVAKPVIFYVNHFPILALPFGTFPVKRGRHTGILVPSPGYNKVDGKYVENIAFYYAYQNYADATFSFNYYEKTGWEWKLDSNYIKRYIFNGNFKAALQKKITSPESSRYEWLLKARHHHDFIDKTTFDANIDFVSSKKIWEGSSNIDERLSQYITSSLAYKQHFLGKFLNVSAYYKDDFLNETKSITLPRISYSLPSKPIYELFLKNENIDEKAWWTNFSFSYNFKAVHSGNIKNPHATFADVIFQNETDSSGNYIDQHNAGLKNSGSIRYGYKMKSWLNLSETVSGSEAIFDRDKNGEKLVSGYDYSGNSSVWFSLYGLRRFDGFYISAVRHILTPKLIFSYSPDFSANDKFYSFGGISLKSSSKQRKLGFSLANTWQLKLKKTTSEKERKINDFFKFNSSLGYDFEKDGKHFGSLSHNFELRPNPLNIKWFTFSMRPHGTILQDIYKLDFKHFNPQKWDFAVDNWTFDVSSKITFSGDANYVDYFPLPENRFVTGKFFQPDSISAEEENTISTLEDLEQLSREQKNWSISFSHSYRTDKSKFKSGDFSSDLRTAVSAKLTKNWSLSYSNYFDLKKKEMVSHNFTITRELHCWRMVFSYTKQGDYWNYSFKIFNIKLPDALKFRTSDHKK